MVQPPRTPNAAELSSIAPAIDPIAPLRAALRAHYDIGREIGQGAFAAVYLARDLKHERQVALKVLLADPTSDTGELRFIREIRMLARLQHPNILPLHDSGHVENFLYYVMPYVSGETLRDRIDREKQLAPEAACNITRDIADALDYAHGQGIIHRDIKPENILLSAGHPILADFGIARAIDLAGVRQLTQTGMGSPGTPAYMSPEQLMGEKQIDGRSDTYSLGCVLFEMLTGTLPFKGKDGFVKRFTEPPPQISTIRKDLPKWMDDVVSKALARSPIDRYQTAHALASALSNNSLPPVLVRADPVPPQIPSPITNGDIGDTARSGENWLSTLWGNHRRRNVYAFVALAALVILIAGGTKLSSWRNSLAASRVDSSRVAVLPFAGTAPQRDREQVANGLYLALSEWRGLALTSDQDVADAINKDGAPTSTRAAASLARRIGAGRFIWGQLDSNDPGHARAQLYDIDSDVALRSITLDNPQDRSALTRVAHDLLKAPDRPAAADGGDGRTQSYTAWNAYGRGHAALANGDFVGAEKEFRNAVNADGAFAPARVWLAQVLAWRPPEFQADWREQVAQAIRPAADLSTRDRTIGLAVARMAERRYPDACAEYAKLTKSDSSDFVGLYGLGQCSALDSLVIPSATSPSHWRFRSRYADAASAYIRALDVNPSAHAIFPFSALVQVLPTASTKTRRGHSANGDEFAAYPALIRDTVVFVPYSLADFANLPAAQTANARNAALAANLDVLLDFATDWTRRAPTSSMAFQALADVLEARGEIARNRSRGLSAIQAITKARQVAVTSREAQLAAGKDAWLRFKQGEFVRARTIADSLLSVSQPRPEDAEALIGLAALTGKLGKISELGRITSDYATAARTVPIPVMDAAAPFVAFAELGVCQDTTAVLERRLDDQILHYVAENQSDRLRQALKARPLSMLAPCTAGKSSLGVEAGSNKLLKLQQAFARSDSRALTALLRGVSENAKTQSPGDVSLDFTYQLAWLRAAMGDTAGATRLLDGALGALPSLSSTSLRDAAASAAAGRAMVLRAEIAHSRGDLDEQRKWARAAADLWATADQPLQPVVTRMRVLAAQSGVK
jgi:eukaryotic-like serine/threonine-protein kinase